MQAVADEALTQETQSGSTDEQLGQSLLFK